MEPIVTLSLKIIPLMDDKQEIYRIVDEVIQLIAQSGLKYEVSASETTIEGPMSQVMAIAIKAHSFAIEKGAKRLQSIMMVDYDVNGVNIEEKVYQYR